MAVALLVVVSMLFASMVTETVDLEKSDASTTPVPSKVPKLPRTLVIIAWRATKPSSLCAGSRVYVPESWLRSVGAVGSAVMAGPPGIGSVTPLTG